MLSTDEIKWLGEALTLYEPLDDVQSDFHKSQADVRWLFGGNQCLGGEQLVYDPVKKVDRRVSEIKEPFHVYAYDGQKLIIAKADMPFNKESEQLYEVKLSNGETIVCSAKHRVLDDSGGWRQISELQAGFSLFQPSSILGSDIITIISQDAKRFDKIWDFNVPRYHNYLTGGVINHNSGKTHTNMMDLAQLVLDVHPFRFTPKGLHWVAIESWEQVRDILWEEKLKKFIPPWHIRNISYGQDKVPRKVFIKNGHVIEFKAFNQGRELFQGRIIDSCHCDEQCHHDFQGILNEIQARLMAKSGFLSWSMTPIIPQSILEERIENLPDTDEVFYADLNTNRESRGGYIPDKRIDDLISEWPEEVRATRVKGRFASFYGAVYKTFNRSIHVINPFKIPEEWPKYRGFDFGFTNPFVCLWIAKDKDENWYVYREYYKAKTGIGEHIANVKKLSMAEDYIVSWADPENAEDRAEMRKAGISTKTARKDISRGIELIQSKLKVKPNGKPSLFIFNNCRNTCREMASYHYPTGSKSKNPADKPVQKNDHAVDALRYVIYSTERPQKKGNIYVAA